MILDFDAQGFGGTVEVVVQRNDDPHSLGCELLIPGIGAEFYEGFPTCTATVEHTGLGYASVFGWLQLVQSTDNESQGRSFELDPLALFSGLPIPFCWYGIKPTLFDAPWRFRETDVVWTAHSFLCVVPTAVVGRVIFHVLGFTWGFTVTDGDVLIAPAEALDPGAWDRHLRLLRTSFPEWEFSDAISGTMSATN